MAWSEKWGSNALVGHLVMIAVGLIPTSIDIILFHQVSDFSVLGVFAAFVVFPPLLLSAKGHGQSESRHVFWLTFGTSSVFGIFVGYMLVGVVWNTGVTYVGFAQLTRSAPFTLSNAYALFAAIRVCIAYWMVGQMSRQYIQDSVAAFGSFPSYTRRLFLFFDNNQMQDEARWLLEALSSFDPDLVLEGWDQVTEKILAVKRNGKHEERLHVMLDRAKNEIEDWENQVDSPVKVVSPVKVENLYN